MVGCHESTTARKAAVCINRLRTVEIQRALQPRPPNDQCTAFTFPRHSGVLINVLDLVVV